MSQIIDGKLVSKQVRQRVKEETEKLKAKGITPGLAVIIVGDDPASQVYVKNKEKACDEVGFYSEKYALPENTTQEELNNLVKELNNKKEISGILCQLPLPKHLDDKEVINLIDPIKDVDAFHPVNVGAIMIGDYNFLPCTPAGVMELIHSTGVDVTGKKAVVIGRSNIVGKPMAALLLRENATVTVAHSKTKDLKSIAKRADILIVAIGKAKFITKDYIKEGAVVIDVGMHRDEQNHLCGDVDCEDVSSVVSAITPVPGGVGPMTIAMLMNNCVETIRGREERA